MPWQCRLAEPISENMLNDQCNTYQSDTGELDARLFERSADCIKIIDLDGRIQRLNPGASLALEVEDLSKLYGLRWEALWPIESQAQVMRSVNQAAGGQSTQFGALCPTAKGNLRWWDVIVYPVIDERAMSAKSWQYRGM